MKAKYLGYKIIGLLAIASIVGGAYLLSPGSAPYAQDYVFSTSEDSLINRLLKIKKEHPNLIPDQDPTAEAADSNETYNIWFKIPSLGEVAHAYLISNEGKSFTTVRLVGFAMHTNQGNWKSINQDYGRYENLKRKNAFKREVLNLVNTEYFDDGNSMMIFWK